MIVMVVLVTAGLAVVALRRGQGAVPAAGGAEVAATPATSPAATPTAVPSPTEPGLLGADDFSGSAPDGRWGLYGSTSPIGGIWSPGSVRVEDGTLRIAGVGRNPTGAGNTSGGLCWCGAGGDRRYGRWELRARFDAGAGYGQTIGLWPQSDRPSDGSVSFSAREADKRTLRMYVVWYDGGRHSDETVLTGDFTAWHTFAVEWRETFVRIGVDGRIVYDSARGRTAVVVPREPMHLYLQQTVGPYEGVPAPNASTPAEVDLMVDWVRMYA